MTGMIIGLIVRSILEFSAILFVLWLYIRRRKVIAFEDRIIEALEIKIKQRRQKDGK